VKKTFNEYSDFCNDPNNANEGTQRGHRIIEHSLSNRGAGRSGLAASDGTLIAGNQTFQKITELGFNFFLPQSKHLLLRPSFLLFPQTTQ
jgi:hypothetical protein